MTVAGSPGPGGKARSAGILAGVRRGGGGGGWRFVCWLVA